MKSGLFRLARQSSVYALGNVLLKVAGLVLHVYYLDQTLLVEAEYGRLILLETTAAFGILLAGMGLNSGLLKYLTDERYAEERPALPFTTLVLTAIAALAVFGLIAGLAKPMAAWLLDDAGRSRVVVLMAGYVAFRVVSMVPYMLLRAKERVGLYVVALVAEWGLLVGGVIWFLGVEQRGLEGVLWAWLLSAAAGALVLGGGVLWQVPWRFRWRLAPRLVRFGLPLALGGLAALVLKVGDQYVLEELRDATTVGVYGWAYKISGVLNMLLVQSLQLAFAVLGVKQLGKDPNDASLHRRVFRHFVIVGGWAALGLALFAYDVTALVSDNPTYLEAAPLVLPLALGFIGYGIYTITQNVLYARERTRLIGYNVALAAGANMVLNLLLIPVFAAWGAALATVLSYALLAGLTTWQAERELPVGFSIRTVVLVLLACVGLYLAARVSVAWGTLPRLGYRIGLFAAYPVLAVMLRLYRWDEVQEGVFWLRSRRDAGRR